jgi:RNA polymerase sigma-70 factor (ECF subfamily)
VTHTLSDDEQLMVRIAAAQTEALGQLYDLYGRLVFSLAVQITGDDAVAEEVTQDVFVQVWNKAKTYDPEQGKLVTWLARIARNRAIDTLRRQGSRPEGHRTEFPDESLEEIPDPDRLEQDVELDQQKARLHSALASLPRDQRAVLELAYFLEMSHQEIANRLNEPLGTVKTRLRLAMQKLRQALVESSVSSR